MGRRMGPLSPVWVGVMPRAVGQERDLDPLQAHGQAIQHDHQLLPISVDGGRSLPSYWLIVNIHMDGVRMCRDLSLKATPLGVDVMGLIERIRARSPRIMGGLRDREACCRRLRQ